MGRVTLFTTPVIMGITHFSIKEFSFWPTARGILCRILVRCSVTSQHSPILPAAQLYLTAQSFIFTYEMMRDYGGDWLTLARHRRRWIYEPDPPSVSQSQSGASQIKQGARRCQLADEMKVSPKVLLLVIVSGVTLPTLLIHYSSSILSPALSYGKYNK